MNRKRNMPETIRHSIPMLFNLGIFMAFYSKSLRIRKLYLNPVGNYFSIGVVGAKFKRVKIESFRSKFHNKKQVSIFLGVMHHDIIRTPYSKRNKV